MSHKLDNIGVLFKILLANLEFVTISRPNTGKLKKYKAINVKIKLLTTPTKAPNILDGIPNIIVAFNNFSNNLVDFFKTAKIVFKIINTKINAITSYSRIFIEVIPANLFEKLKNGINLYKIPDTTPLNIKDSTITAIVPTVSTNCLVNPLLKPIAAPNNINTIIKISTIFIVSHLLNKLYHIIFKNQLFIIYQYFIKCDKIIAGRDFMATITLKISENTKKEMEDFFEDFKREKTPPYAVFQADDADCVVTVYESGKAVFQGMSADISAQLWIERERHLNPTKTLDVKNSEEKKKEKEKKEYIDPKIYHSNAIGSDEVGTGDYFGPIVVTSAYVAKENIPWLEELGVKDSKKMTDEKILQVVPEIIKRIPYKSTILSNKEYNERYNEDTNMNKLKAILHNKVLVQLTNEIHDWDYVIVDQFAQPFVYFNYLKSSNAVFRKITFLTKGEDKSLAVACASLISRFIFLKEFNKLGEQLDMFLLKGASDKVDEVGVKIVEKYGFDKLSEVAKLNFKNTDKIKEKISK